ncbi:hypothetical protein CBM2586_B10219 [Cupriavidus phytorum]|uniref:Uncharacterized protein n=1 Tax=Cupriavidus taiwanensis TaxID=164546 RepID=A0A375C9D4_9BURK|nr:hypothetical protein [Cupriavidus taiwanensis]SOY65624.1 hypothetical protein CBM2586_B10219 [Cupriavidus taiwanensis]
MQREIRVLGEARALKDAPAELVSMCRTGLDAIHLCIQLSGYGHYFIAEELGIDKGHMSRMMQGKAGFPTDKRIKLMELCGNRAPVQFEALGVGCELVELSKDAQIRALEKQLAALKAA